MSIKLENKIETILFLESEPVSIDDLAKKLGISQEDCLEELKKIKDNYRKNNSSFDLVFTKNEVQLVIKKDLAPFIKDYYKNDKTEQLSPAILEVLAIISYKSPISKAEIEYIRGVNCSSILRKLALRGLIEKKEKIANSRIFSYEPSLKLFKKLGILQLKDLPNYDKLTKDLKIK